LRFLVKSGCPEIRTTPQPKELPDQVPDGIRLKPYACSAGKNYVYRAKRFVLYHKKRHSPEMGEKEISQLLTYLAAEENVAASTQNQALGALLFPCQDVLHTGLDLPLELARAKRPNRLPTVLTKEEVRQLIAQLPGIHRHDAQVRGEKGPINRVQGSDGEDENAGVASTLLAVARSAAPSSGPLGHVRHCGWIYCLRHGMLRPGGSRLRCHPTPIAEQERRRGGRQPISFSTEGQTRRGRSAGHLEAAVYPRSTGIIRQLGPPLPLTNSDKSSSWTTMPSAVSSSVTF